MEISVTTGNEAAEAVAAMLSRYGSVAIEELTATPTSGSTFAPVVTVRCYLLADQAERQREAIDTGLWHLSQLLPIEKPQYHTLTEHDWMDAWKKHYPVVHAGERLVIVPSWRQYDPRPGEVTIAVDPGMAFGTGLHPSTQLCLRAVERYTRPGQSVLDVGTGTGILAIAAMKLGAASVLAMDVEETAVAAATENVARNGVADRVTVHLASLIPMRNPLGEQPGVIDGGSYDLVLVNIIAEVIAAMADRLLARTAPGGLIIAAGIIEEREPVVMEAFAGRAEVVDRELDGDWVCLCLRPLP
ncbi:MAG: 50S ribosomal protein L11 methyltransferase [Anaerolineae bacterium]